MQTTAAAGALARLPWDLVDDQHEPAVEEQPPAVSLGHAIAVYTVLRLGLMAVITVALMWFMPLIVALAFAVVAQLPLAIVLFPKQRRDLTAALAHAKADRTAERDRLRAALTGDAQDED